MASPAAAAAATANAVSSAAMASRSKTARETAAQLKAAFALVDEDHSGFIDEEELIRVLVSIGMSRQRAHEAFEEADINHDHQVSYDEFIAWALSDDLHKSYVGIKASGCAKSKEALAVASQAALELKRRDIRELRRLVNPPDAIVEVCVAVAILLRGARSRFDWASLQKMLEPPMRFIAEVRELDPDSITAEQLALLRDMRVGGVAFGVSNAAVGLLEWVLAMRAYAEGPDAPPPQSATEAPPPPPQMPAHIDRVAPAWAEKKV